MSHFNYFPTTPYSNPAGDIEKQTNEIPEEIKSETTTKKRSSKKAKTTTKAKAKSKKTK